MSVPQQGSVSITTSSTSTSLDDLKQWDAVLTTIRANLDLIVRTWGRKSAQYREAKGVMLECLEENVARMQTGSSQREGSSMEGAQDGNRGLQKSIEELMQELSI
jgi:hypothetical protein